MAANKNKNKHQRERRERRAARRRATAVAPGRSGPTFGEIIEQADLINKISTATRTVIAKAEEFIKARARKKLTVISCHDCTAAKGCCTLTTGAWLHEAVPIAARLRREGRDTPELRQSLRVSAQNMETLSPSAYRRACVFLSADERCTVYDDRPAECGTAFVSSPPTFCSDPSAEAIQKFVHPFGEMSAHIERQFEHEAGLVPLRGPYMGALPRMVLLCLQAWERSDYAEYLAEHGEAAAMRAIAATGGAVDLVAIGAFGKKSGAPGTDGSM